MNIEHINLFNHTLSTKNQHDIGHDWRKKSDNVTCA